METAAYRIVQEALTNVIRHANATAVTIALVLDGQALRLQILDNGTAPAAPITAGSGIIGMTERARLLGGMLIAQAQPGGGFVVNATLPLEETE